MQAESRGSRHRFLPIPAVPAKEILANDDRKSLRRYIEVNGALLDSDDAVLDNIEDWEELATLETAAYEFNFGFLRDWRVTPIPAKMASRFIPASSPHADPLVAALVAGEVATYQQLRETYSLREALVLLDILTVKRINEWKAINEKC